MACLGGSCPMRFVVLPAPPNMSSSFNKCITLNKLVAKIKEYKKKSKFLGDFQ